MKIKILLLIFWASFGAVKAQVEEDSISSPSDSIRIGRRGKVVTIESYAKRFSPRKALLYSAILPGAGQVYNKKYWKVPIVYGLIGVGIYAIDEYQFRHTFFKKQLFAILNEPDTPVVNPDTGLTQFGNRLSGGNLVSAQGYNEEQLRNIINRYRRDRDFSMLVTAVIYFAQLIDAHVDAHLKEFDLNPQLKISLEPSIQQNAFTGRSAGLSLNFRF